MLIKLESLNRFLHCNVPWKLLKSWSIIFRELLWPISHPDISGKQRISSNRAHSASKTTLLFTLCRYEMHRPNLWHNSHSTAELKRNTMTPNRPSDLFWKLLSCGVYELWNFISPLKTAVLFSQIGPSQRIIPPEMFISAIGTVAKFRFWITRGSWVCLVH